MANFDYELIVCIVNEGFSDAVMDAAKEVGATGGTVIDARGTASKEAEKLFSIVVQPQKEIVMIVVPSEIRDKVLHALYKEVGLNTAGQGIAFSLPVDNVVGIRAREKNEAETKTEEKTEENNAETAASADTATTETADAHDADATAETAESASADKTEEKHEKK